MRQVPAPKVEGDKCIPWPFYPLLQSLLRTACFSLLVLKFLFFTPYLCRSSKNHSGLWEQQCRMKGFGAACLCWHRGTTTHQALWDQTCLFALTILIITHVCVFKNIVVFIYIDMVYTCMFWWWDFFFIYRKNIILETSSLWIEVQLRFQSGKGDGLGGCTSLVLMISCIRNTKIIWKKTIRLHCIFSFLNVLNWKAEGESFIY